MHKKESLKAILVERIESHLNKLNALTDDQLLNEIMPWIEEELPKEGLYAGMPLDRFKEWLQSEIFPNLKKLGEKGQHAWDMLRDPNSALSKERVASIILTLSVFGGFQPLDISTLVAIVVMAIRCKAIE